jgi:hypothetical protein
LRNQGKTEREDERKDRNFHDSIESWADENATRLNIAEKNLAGQPRRVSLVGARV